MLEYAKWVWAVLPIACVRVKANGTIVFSFGEQTHEWAPKVSR